MKIYTLILSIILFVFFFTSCEKVIEFNGTVTNPMVVVNSIISPDSVVKAQVSLSRFFLSSQDTFTMVDNGTVTLFVNGIQKELLTHTASGTYAGTYYKPIAGDSIRLVVQTPGMNTVSCGTSIIPKTTIISIDTMHVFTDSTTPITVFDSISGTTTKIGNSIGRNLKFVLKFTDNPTVQNYYRLVVLTKTHTSKGTTSDYSFSFDDIVSGNTNKNSVGPPTSLTSNKFNVFSDDLFNGKTYPLTFSIPDNVNVYTIAGAPVVIRKDITITLQSISQSYYLYLQTRAAIKTNTFFAEPVQIYSNVDGGMGVLGSYTSSIWRISVKP